MSPVKIGIVKGYRESDHTARVELQPEGVTTDWIRVASPTAHSGWGFRAPLAPDEEVLVLCPEGSIVQAVVVGGLFGPLAAAPATGTKSIHLEHSSGAKLELTAAGDVLLNGGEYRLPRYETLEAKYNAHVHSNAGGVTTPPQGPQRLVQGADACPHTKAD